MTKPKIAIIGLGYVGLPLALALAKEFDSVMGFDIDARKIEAMKQGRDVNGEGYDQDLRQTKLLMTADKADLKGYDFFIVCVPTPVDKDNTPDLTPLQRACVTVGNVVSPGSIVVFESTVYPGVTEEICGPIIEEVSGLKQSVDFKLGYSPERMNPGDKEHALESVVKVVSGEDSATLDKVAAVYGAVVKAGVHKAATIKVAEAAKVIENTQRDLNIALMNELAMIFDRMDIPTRDVIQAAGTKWNFNRYYPGLVGGHCIGVDPYYLTSKAQQLGYHPQVILAGRRINDGMGQFIAQKMVTSHLPVKGAKIGVLGLTFKENVSDIRNSRVPDIINELREFGAVPMITDPYANSEETEHEYGIKLNEWSELSGLDGMILAVSHKKYLEMDLEELLKPLNKGAVLIDVKSVLDRSKLPSDVVYWSL
jgi:UDP-N-acetyl-D-glucosamine/UDP-N-acetyl-D-galactosamine dehydrogenase